MGMRSGFEIRFLLLLDEDSLESRHRTDSGNIGVRTLDVQHCHRESFSQINY
jgi:hypothetical protein